MCTSRLSRRFISILCLLSSCDSTSPTFLSDFLISDLPPNPISIPGFDTFGFDTLLISDDSDFTSKKSLKDLFLHPKDEALERYIAEVSPLINRGEIEAALLRTKFSIRQMGGREKVLALFRRRTYCLFYLGELLIYILVFVSMNEDLSISLIRDILHPAGVTYENIMRCFENHTDKRFKNEARPLFEAAAMRVRNLTS